MKFILFSCCFAVFATVVSATDAGTRSTPVAVRTARLLNPSASAADALLPEAVIEPSITTATVLIATTPAGAEASKTEATATKKLGFFAKWKALKSLLREVKAYKKEQKRSSVTGVATAAPAVVGSDAGGSGINITNRQYLIFGAVSLGLLLLGLLIVGGAGAFFWVIGAVGLVTLLVLYLIQHV